jgi:Uma2 family endonuclease
LPIDPPTVLSPDIAFVRAERLPSGIRRGYVDVVPDFVAELRSPGERRADVDRKIDIYLRSGVRMVVYVELDDRTMTVYRPGRPRRVLQAMDELDGEDVIPGFRLLVGSIFPPRADE